MSIKRYTHRPQIDGIDIHEAEDGEFVLHQDLLTHTARAVKEAKVKAMKRLVSQVAFEYHLEAGRVDRIANDLIKELESEGKAT